MKSTRVLIRAKGRGLCIERGLHDCLQRELFADVTFSCDQGKIRANRGVLAAASPVLSSLLKDLPLIEDSCIIMAGYSMEEVQGLVRYIYTGQLSAPKVHGSSWERIIGDFKVGAPLENDDDLASIHELTDYGEETTSSNKFEPEPNGTCHQQTASTNNKFSPSRGVGPKIVAVTSPRPLIVQVQSLTQAQNANPDMEPTCDGIPGEMTIEEGAEGFISEASSLSARQQSIMKRKRIQKPMVAIQSGAKKPLVESRSAPVAVTASSVRIAPKKPGLIVGKRLKPASSKFARKKYVCPHCNRRFLTRGNIKNHLRTHSKEKPFQCPVCQDLFAYQGAYQRHLYKHVEKYEMTESELAPIIAESHRLAGEIAKGEQESVQVLEDEEVDEKESTELQAGDHVGADNFAEEIEEQEEVEGDDEENGDLVEEEEAHIAQKLQNKASPGSSTSGMGTHFMCADESELVEKDDDGYDESSSTRKKAAITAKGKRGSSFLAIGPKAGTGKNSEQPSLNRVKYQVIECDFCPMKYHKWSAFYVHRCMHTGEAPVFPCGVCGLEFPSIKALKDHKTAEHRESLFQCDGCDRTFLSRSALVMHQPVHSADLNFKCRFCSEKMRTLKERYVHERIHTSEASNYQCSHCEKQFNSLVSLRCHLKVHGKEQDSSAASETIASTSE